MTQIAVRPRVFKNYYLKIDAYNYEKHVSTVTLTPSTSIQTWKGATPDAVFSDATSATYVLDLGYAQDWETPESLSLFLMNHEGETIENVEFGPLGPTGPRFLVDIIIVPGSIGGAVDAYGTSTVQLGVQGKPEYLPSTPTTPVVAAISPAAGPKAGGDVVVISGRGFTDVTDVEFDSDAAAFTVLTDGTLVAVTPEALTAGPVDVTLTNALGESSPVTFTFED